MRQTEESRKRSTHRQQHYFPISFGLLLVGLEAYVLLYVNYLWDYGLSRSVWTSPLPWLDGRGPELLAQSFLAVNLLLIAFLWVRSQSRSFRQMRRAWAVRLSYVAVAVLLGAAQVAFSTFGSEAELTLTQLHP